MLRLVVAPAFNAFSAKPIAIANNVAAVNAVLKSEWACYGLARYLSAKLMWNADLDVEELKRDFCCRMFPNATEDFQKFISLYGMSFFEVI